MADVRKVVSELNAGWYNYITNILNLDPATFQLAQGVLGLQSFDSSGLFLMSDAVPPQTVAAYYDASGLSRRSSAFNALLHALVGEGGNDVRGILGDQYANWIAYRNADTSELTQQQLFEKWASRHLDPGKASQAISAFKQYASAPLNAALDAMNDPDNQQTFVNSAGNNYKLYTYTATIDAAKQAIAGGGAASINFDSSTMETSLEHTWAKASASGFYDIFSGGASGGFDKLSQKASGSRLTITGTIGSYATLITQPGAWFSSNEFTRAYNGTDDDTIWMKAQDWDSYFQSENGSLARRVSEFILLSGYDITVTSHASYNESDKLTIESAANFGIWPFFSASAGGSHTTTHTVNQDGSLSVRYTLNKGEIRIWGVNVQPAPF